jgi:hypothetical protein
MGRDIYVYEGSLEDLKFSISLMRIKYLTETEDYVIKRISIRIK